MNELSEELKAVTPDVHWDEERGAFYVRARDLPPSDTTGFIQRLRQVLETAPDNTGARFVLAGFLQRSGQRQEARAELQQVAQAGDKVWSPQAQQALAMTDN